MRDETFSSWLNSTRRALVSGEDVEVPCGDCRGCCTSSYFIHIKPDETKTLARIPKSLQFRAPGLPKGHVLLGYDQNGHCPMFIDNKCSIYDVRPQTCRNYDCRIFTATGIAVDEDKKRIAEQTVRWKFDVDSVEDSRSFAAVQAAGKFIRDFAEYFPEGFLPSNPTQQAVVAIKVYRVFLTLPDDSDNTPNKLIIENRVKRVLTAFKNFEAGLSD